MNAGEKIGQGDFIDMFREKIDEELDRPVPILFDDGDDGAMVDQGVALLRMFHEKADTPAVLAVEQAFSIDLYDPLSGEMREEKLVGAMDLVIQGAKLPVIVEHKTASKRYASWQLATEVQPSVYVHAAREIGIGEADVRYQLLIKSKVPALQQCPIHRSVAQVNEALETFCTVLRAIEAEVFFKNRSWACADCTFAYRCNEGGGG